MKKAGVRKSIHRTLGKPTGQGAVRLGGKVFLYAFLCVTGFVFLYPLLKMISMSFMTADDLVNPLVSWVPYGFEIANFTRAMQVLGYWQTLWTTVYVSVLPAILQTLV